MNSLFEAISTSECRSGIILYSIGDVKTALETYWQMNDRSENDRSDRPNWRARGEDMVKDLETAFGQRKTSTGRGKDNTTRDMVRIFYADNVRRSLDSLVERLGEQPMVDVSFDHDATGTPFYKMAVTITKAGNNYVLNMVAARVGNAPEFELAKELNRPMGMVAAGINARLARPKSGIYAVEYRELLRPLTGVVDAILPKNIGREDTIEEVGFDCGGRYFLSARVIHLDNREKTGMVILGVAEKTRPKTQWNGEQCVLETVDEINYPELVINVVPGMESLRKLPDRIVRMLNEKEKSELVCHDDGMYVQEDIVPQRGHAVIVKPDEIQRLCAARDYLKGFLE